MSKFCILDIETIGFKPHRDNIWAISGIKVLNGNVDSVFDSLVKPRGPLKAREFCAASGLSPDIFEEAAPIGLVAEKAFDFFRGFVVYAYNAPFDQRMLATAHSGLGRLAYQDYLPIVKARRPGLRSYKLAEVSKHFRLKHQKNGYDSMNDCYVLLDLIKILGL